MIACGCVSKNVYQDLFFIWPNKKGYVLTLLFVMVFVLINSCIRNLFISSKIFGQSDHAFLLFLIMCP